MGGRSHRRRGQHATLDLRPRSLAERHRPQGRLTLATLAAAHAAGRTDINAHYEGSFQDWRNSGEPIARD
jgi:hypothetical protein